MFEYIKPATLLDDEPTVENIKIHIKYGKYDAVPGIANKIFKTIYPQISYKLPSYIRLPNQLAEPDPFLKVAYYVCISYLHIDTKEYVKSVFSHIDYLNSMELDIPNFNYADHNFLNSDIWKSVCICYHNRIPHMMLIKGFSHFKGSDRLRYFKSLEKIFIGCHLDDLAYHTQTIIAAIMVNHGLYETSYDLLSKCTPPTQLEYAHEIEMGIIAKFIGAEADSHFKKALKSANNKYSADFIAFLRGDLSIDHAASIATESWTNGDEMAPLLLAVYTSLGLTTGDVSRWLSEKLLAVSPDVARNGPFAMTYFTDTAQLLNVSLSKGFKDRMACPNMTRSIYSQ